MTERNIFRDIVFDWLKDTFKHANVHVKSRALAFVDFRNTGGTIVEVRVRTSFVLIGGHNKTFTAESPEFFQGLHAEISKHDGKKGV